jgi:D-3-phosphoglycerate dehydrogenase
MAAIFLDCTDDLIGPWNAVLKPGDPDIAVNMANSKVDDIAATLAGYDIAVNDHTYFTADTFAACTNLRRIVFLGTGASSFIDLDAAARHNVAVDTIKGYGDTTVAEHTIALMMAAARGIACMDREVRAGRWRQIEGVQMLGKTLGILGLGGIGSEVARIAAGIGMKTAVWNRTPTPGANATLNEVLATADFLAITLALNDQTRGFLDADKLNRTKPGLILINTARADIIDATTLTTLLISGHIRHAAIDVFSQEPPTPTDPLLTQPNTTLTAHAGFMTPEATTTMLRRAVDLVAAGQ